MWKSNILKRPSLRKRLILKEGKHFTGRVIGELYFSCVNCSSVGNIVLHKQELGNEYEFIFIFTSLLIHFLMSNYMQSHSNVVNTSILDILSEKHAHIPGISLLIWLLDFASIQLFKVKVYTGIIMTPCILTCGSKIPHKN